MSLLINDTSSYHPLFNIVSSCKALLKSDWSCNIHHVYREGNNIADGLANLGHSLDLGIMFFEEPPSQILCALDDDFKGLAMARLVPMC